MFWRMDVHTLLFGIGSSVRASAAERFMNVRSGAFAMGAQDKVAESFGIWESVSMNFDIAHLQSQASYI